MTLKQHFPLFIRASLQQINNEKVALGVGLGCSILPDELVTQSPQAESSAKPDGWVVEQVRTGLANCVQTNETGRQQLTLKLPIQTPWNSRHNVGDWN